VSAAPRAGLRDVEPYSSPQPEVPVRLNTNECPLPLPPGFSEELARAARELALHRYPDSAATRLREELASHAGHPLEGTWAANGSNEVIQQVLLAYGGPGRAALTFEPTYGVHGRIAWLTHTEHRRVELAEPFAIDDRAIDAAVETGPDVVFVCTPNNPTGTAQPLASVRAVTERTRALVVVDQAYLEFGGEDAVPLVRELPNVVVVRTLSKAFALAGARIGYALATPEVVDDLQRVRLPYHLSALTQAAGIAALHHRTEALGILDAVRTQRDRLLHELGGRPDVQVFPSEANFVLFRPDRPAGDVWRGLLDRGVLVRDLSSVVPNALRVTAGTEHEVDRFLEALGEVLG